MEYQNSFFIWILSRGLSRSNVEWSEIDHEWWKTSSNKTVLYVKLLKI